MLLAAVLAMKQACGCLMATLPNCCIQTCKALRQFKPGCNYASQEGMFELSAAECGRLLATMDIDKVGLHARLLCRLGLIEQDMKPGVHELSLSTAGHHRHRQGALPYERFDRVVCSV